MPDRASPTRRAWQFWRPDVAAEVDEELRFHLEARAAEYEVRGHSPADAARAARERFGDVARVRHQLVTHDAARERRRSRREHVQRLAHDIRLTLRGLRRTPGFTATVVLILALGLGMATAVFTVVHAVLLRRLPVRDQDRVVVLWGTAPGTLPDWPLPWPEFVRLRDGTRALSGVAGWQASAVPQLLRRDDVGVEFMPQLVTGNFFQVLGARPLLGRVLRPGDDVPGADGALVLSYAAWRRLFRGDPGVIGQRVTVSGWPRALTVAGVLEPGLDLPAGTDAWIPMRAFTADSALARVPMHVVGRLAPGATRDRARAEFLAVLRAPDDPAAANPEFLRHAGAEARPLADVVVGDVRPALVALAAAVALLLLIACTNVGTLLLVRAAGRARETAVRRALGAGRGQIVRQLLGEGVVLGAAGAAGALVLADALVRALVAMAPAGLPRLDTIRTGAAPVVIAAALALLTTALAGLAPALWSAGPDLASPLRRGTRVGTGRGARLARGALVAWQVALAVVVLAAAALVTRSLARLQQVDLGYRAAGAAIVKLDWPWDVYGAVATSRDPMARIVARVEALPGVVAATPLFRPPLAGDEGADGLYVAEGQDPALAARGAFIDIEAAGPDFFRTFGIPVLRGRVFTAADRENAPHVVVVSEAVARQFWPGQDVLGKRLRLNADAYQHDWLTVVGVVPEVRYRTYRTAAPSLYYPARQFGAYAIRLGVRTAGPPSAMLPAIRRAIAEAEPRVGVWRLDTIDALLGAPLAQPRLNSLLLAAFALTALLLSAVGLYGLTATTVRQQTRELGVRIALGASPARVGRLVLRQAFAVAALGAAVGLAGALGTSRLLRSLLFEVSPADPGVLAGVCAVLLTVALLAAYAPARRATRVDPVEALRAE